MGFILSLVFPGIMAQFSPDWGSFIGLLLAGFVVGIIVKGGAFNGFWNASVAGAFGGLLSAILITIIGTAAAGLAGFAVGALSGLILFIGALIQYMVSMGIGGAIGAAISN